MQISWNWLGDFVDLTALSGPQALADLLTARGLEVEAIERQDKGFEKVVTAQILERNPHPQADRLSLCKVTLGSGDPLEIVCGAQNMKAGDKVALAQIGAHLPNGIEIGQSKIRGVASHGMLCSEEELKLKEQSEGILILPPETALGVPLAQILGRNDTILSLKLTANRGDCLSHNGIAREVAAALGKPLKKPEIHTVPYGKSPITIGLEAGELGPQFYGVAISGVKIGPSPEWLSRRLEALGIRSINNVVDASNWVMMELGHPTHAYDADKIHGKKLHVRTARQGESLPLLDGETIQLEGFELVISDEERAVGLAGVMGGGNSEVQPETQNLFLECAEFDPRCVRKAAAKYGRKTEAAHRFERGVDPEGLENVMGRLVHLVLKLAGGKMTGAIAAKLPSRTTPQKREIHFNKDYLYRFLGFDKNSQALTTTRIREILVGLNCKVSEDSQGWTVVPPSYRLDLRIKEDIAEEVARSLGYDQIPATIPPLSSLPNFGGSSLGDWALMDRAKEALKCNGLYETVNFAFTSKAWLEKFGMKPSVNVLNPLSEEHEAMVPSLLPGLVRNSLDNWNHHFGSEPLAIRLFELRPVFSAAGTIEAKSQTETGVQESWKLALVLSGPRYAESLRSERGEVDFYDLKSVIDGLLTVLGTKGVRYQPLSSLSNQNNALASNYSNFHPGQSALVYVGSRVAGCVGLLHPGKAQELKTRAPLWLAELDWDAVAKLSRGPFSVPTYKPWPTFPTIERDFALVVSGEVTAEKICQIAMKVGKPVAKGAKVFDIYRGSQVGEGMTSVAVRVIFYDEGRSLQESEAEAASARIVESWKKELGAELRS